MCGGGVGRGWQYLKPEIGRNISPDALWKLDFI
ncbi:protein of unknown function [Methanoculleus bourgensis]|uniref:Uncharacterized protein n=1 Tax=Methanoculleus bourgensis TaxID=83986 RepID=A0A110BIV0_9EURY|nr:protein of unknown function [Methanoculleus bourgensis]